jgi:hypothetical protein
MYRRLSVRAASCSWGLDVPVLVLFLSYVFHKIMFFSFCHHIYEFLPNWEEY